MRRVARAVAVSVTALVVGALGAGSWMAAAAAADKPGSDVVSASVPPGSQTNASGGYYLIKAGPGAVVTQQAKVQNLKDHEVTARIEAIDGFTADATGASYGVPGSTPSRAGAWIVVATPEVTLQPGEERIVDFGVHIPSDAEPGQYLGALSFSVPLATTTTSAVGSGKAGFQVTLQGQRVIAVQIEVPGPSAPKLVVKGATAYGTNDGVTLQVAIANAGNAFAKGTGAITIADTNLDTSFKIDTFVSGTEIQYRVPWTDAIVPGVHAIRVRLKYGNGRITTWNGEIAIRGALQAKLVKQLNNTKLVAKKKALSPILIALVVLLALALFAGAVWVRQRRTRGSGPGRPGGDDARGERRVPAMVN